MKKEFLYTVFAMILGGVILTSCSEDKLRGEIQTSSFRLKSP